MSVDDDCCRALYFLYLVCFIPLSHFKIILQRKDTTRDSRPNKTKVIPSHSAQAQSCACTSAKWKYRILRLLSCICGHDHVPLLKQLSVVVTHILGNHFPYLLLQQSTRRCRFTCRQCFLLSFLW